MSPTTIRIEDALMNRVAAAADRAGKTAHAFILEATTQTVEQTEGEEELHRIADERWAHSLASGKFVPWEDARNYLQAQATGKRARRPVPRVLQR